MKASKFLTPQQWQSVQKTCNTCTSEFLLNAINETSNQREKSVISQAGAGDVSHSTLVKIVYQLIKKTDTCDEDGSHLWIDPEGKFKITIERIPLIIKNLQIGTKLMWDASPNSLVDPNKRIIYPAIVVQKHWNKQMVLIKSGNTTNWMGPQSDYLRYPTDEELQTLTWPTI